MTDTTDRDIIRRYNIERVRTFYDRQQAMDFTGWMRLWADDAGQDIPFAPEGFPTSVQGKAELENLYRPLFDGFTSIDIRDLRVDPFADPSRVMARWHTHGPLKNGGLYENDLLAIFEFDADGLIIHLTEYLNPLKVNIGPEGPDGR